GGGETGPAPTSSNRFGSSGQTATMRGGAAAASERSAPGNRFGDSNATVGQGEPASSRHNAARPASRRGKKPTNAERVSARPLATRAVSTAEGPGRTATPTPASPATRNSRIP